MYDISWLANLIERGWKVAALFALGSALVLFVPITALRDWADANRGAWWALFLFAFAGLCVFGLAALFPIGTKWVSDWRGAKAEREQAEQLIKGLSPDEHAVLRCFLGQKGRTVRLEPTPAVRALVNRLVLLPIEAGLAHGIAGPSLYQIRDVVVWDYLQEHPEAVGYHAPNG